MSWWVRWLTGTLLLGAVAGGFLLVATGVLQWSSSPSLTTEDRWEPRHRPGESDGGGDAGIVRFKDPRDQPGGRHVAKANDRAYGRYVSRHGRAYFIQAYAPGPSHHESGVASFILVRRADGSPPIEPWFWFDGPEGQEDRLMEDLVDPGDIVLARGWMPFGTGVVHVADDGRVVLVDLRGFESSQVLALDTKFRPLWSVPGERLFPGRWPVDWPDWSAGKFVVSSGGIHWHRASWLDDERQAFVVVGWDHEVSGLRLADGAPCDSTALEETVVGRLDGPEHGARAAAWRVACQQRWFSAEAAARRTLEDVSARPDSRALAALLLGRIGDPSGRDVLLEVRDRIEEHTHLEFVWEHLDDVLGADAMGDWSARLVSPVETESCTLRGSASAVVRTGAPAIRSLVEALARTTSSPHDLDPAESALANWRDGERLDGELAWTSSSVTWRNFDETAAWAAFAASGASRDLRELLSEHVVASEDGHRSRTSLCLPALRRVAVRPDSSLAAEIATFLTDFTSRPDGIAVWQALVRAEASSALAAIRTGR